MQDKRKPFKAPPKKYHPKGMTVLFEDQDIIVVDKVNGLLTTSDGRHKDSTAHFILNNYVKKGNSRSKNRVYVVHRLDRDTSGILIFAKNEKSKQFLQENWSEFTKKYHAVVHGKPEEKEGEITSYLLENKAFQVYSTKDESKGKFAKTGYKILKSTRKYSLLEVTLFTGRKHQIRVHLSDTAIPVIGDKVYGAKDGMSRLALHASSLEITHPYSKEKMFFETKFPEFFKELVRR